MPLRAPWPDSLATARVLLVQWPGCLLAQMFAQGVTAIPIGGGDVPAVPCTVET